MVTGLGFRVGILLPTLSPRLPISKLTVRSTAARQGTDSVKDQDVLFYLRVPKQSGGLSKKTALRNSENEKRDLNASVSECVWHTLSLTQGRGMPAKDFQLMGSASEAPA